MKLTDFSLSTDLYELTMAQGYWECGKIDEQACFYSFFRKNPFHGGYAIASGFDHVAEIVENFTFDDEAIEYLAGLNAPGGGKLFKPEFLEYLSNLKLSVDIDAVHEGTVVFPNDPLLRVTGSILEAQLLETALLNAFSFETLIATKAARVCLEAKAPVSEFGLRRAQGEAGGLLASRAAVVGGCSSTSNVLAGKTYGIPVSGTHAHSWVMSFPSELEAFRAYAKVMPKNCVLLVDTYDIVQGIKNAITVGHELAEQGDKLTAIRIDSGDLSWEAKRARKMLDEAGLTETGIILSNDLDEYSVKSIIDSGAKITGWGVGTKLATAYDQPALGAVYKISSKRMPGGEWEDCLKVSGNAAKLTVPGILDVRRYRYADGHLAGDMVFDINSGVSDKETIIDPADMLRQKNLAGLEYETLLHPLARGGEVVLEDEFRDAMAAQKRAKEGIESLDESQRRILNPHSYPVGLEHDLFFRRRSLISKLKHLDEE